MIPGAPASRHVSTARVTLGTAPPLEFLKVATLLTFTDSETIERARLRPFHELRQGKHIVSLVWWRIVTVLLAFGVVACDRVSSGPTPLLIKILAFGDSITEGQNGNPPAGPCGQLLCIDLPNAYPTVLIGLLDDAFRRRSFAIVNAGIGGEPAVGIGEARLPHALASYSPEILLLLHGTNDLLGGQSPANISNALRNMIRTAKTQGVPHIFVSTLLPQRPGGTPPRGTASAFVVPANNAIKPMIASEGAVLVDGYAAFVGHESTYLANDGLHLTPLGNEVLAELFFQAIDAAVFNR